MSLLRYFCSGAFITVSFVHLCLHIRFSLVDGLARVRPLAKIVAGLGMLAVTVTNQNNMCPPVKFYKATMDTGIKPICETDVWFASHEEDGPLSRLSLPAMSVKGYRNLVELILHD